MDNCQQGFHQLWGHLQNPHVRALAWLLTSPHLLSPYASVWDGANIAPAMPSASALHHWLFDVDAQPDQLHQMLMHKQHRRLGLYAETLFEFYLHEHTDMFAHGLQLHDARARTIGEFDFLERRNDALVHWELATKFYLFCPADPMLAIRQQTVAPDLYDYLGPNLADSLGAKMRKILQQQMQLSRHPLAVTTLPLPVNTVQALIKGWLFYRDAEFIESGGAVEGMAADHCRGHIWTQADLWKLSFDGALLLDRLEWLAPAQVNAEAMWDTETLMQNVVRSFEVSKAPLMLVLFSKCEGLAREASRGMVVPDAWWSQAQDARLRLRT